MNILELHGVSKKFGQRTVIKDLSLSIPEKTIVALMGKSGSGKSTILNMIGMLENLDAGTIKIKGKTLPAINSHQATLMRRQMINYLFQSFALINDLTVRENLYIAMEFLALPKPQKEQLILQTLQNLNIEQLLDQTINTLSGGE